MSDVDSAVQVEGLTKVYVPSPRWMGFLLRSAITSPVTALGGVSLSVQPGEICAIVGPNGAGKSTLFRILTGLTTATSGTARVQGIDVSSAPRAVRALTGFVPAGDQTLYLRLSCADNLLFHGQLAGLRGGRLRARVAEALELVGLAEAAERVGFALSAGMRARLQLARAILHHPQVLILDEPTAAVDPVGSYELLRDVERVAREDGVAVLLSSHRLEEIEALHNRVVLMDGGLIAYDGDLDSLPRLARQRTVHLRFATEDHRARAAASLRALPDVRLLGSEGLAPTELAAVSDVAVGPLVARLDSVLDGLTGIEEARPPLREVIYGMLQNGTHAGTSETEDGA